MGSARNGSYMQFAESAGKVETSRSNFDDSGNAIGNVYHRAAGAGCAHNEIHDMIPGIVSEPDSYAFWKV